MRKLLAVVLCFALAAPSLSFAKGSRGSRSHKSTTTKSKKGGIPCSDGSTSHAKHTQGACGHHKGIKK